LTKQALGAYSTAMAELRIISATVKEEPHYFKITKGHIVGSIGRAFPGYPELKYDPFPNARIDEIVRTEICDELADASEAQRKLYGALAKVKPLDIPDNHHLRAAQGWFELGNHIEANAELENITPALRTHPEVLSLRFEIYSKAEKWDYAAEIARTIADMLPNNPYGAFHLAFSLHELKKTKDAYDVLIAVVDKFPEEHLMRYNLACYSCQLGNLKEAYQWLERAIDLAGKKDIRQMALDDPDLEPLWVDITQI
jgi:tetratricopeptide (TPR) repeat protein